MKNSCDVKRVIELLHDSRREQHVIIERLCDGICTKSMLEKVELGKRTLNRNYLNRLLARLGIDQRKYEKYLYHAEYADWRERNDIINAVEDGNLEQAEAMLYQLEQRYDIKDKLELQFCKFVKAQILQHRGVSDEEVLELYRDALLLTVPNAYTVEAKILMLSADEFNLMLECRRREMIYSDAFELYEIYQGLINYIENSSFDICCRAKIYPKTVVYMYNHIMQGIKVLDARQTNIVHIRMLKYCENAIELLRQNNRSYYLCELLEVHVKLLEYLSEVDEYKCNRHIYIQQLSLSKEILQTYIDVCHKYSISPYMQDCCFLYREEEVYCINDVLHKRREMLGMTMTTLGENICSARTISRFEKKERNALEGIVDELFLRLGMSNEYINLGIFTRSKVAVDIYEKCRRAINARDEKLSKELYSQLEHTLEDNKINRQVLLQLKSLILWSNGEISNTTHIRNIDESIRYTVRFVQMKKKNKQKFFSYPEIQGVHDIGVTLYKKGDCIGGMKKIDVLVKYFETIEEEGLADAFIGLYEMVMVSQANMAGSAGEYDYSTELFAKVNRLALKLKRTNLLHYNEYNIAWNEQNVDKNIDRYKTAVKRCICLCKLTHNKFYEENYERKL